MNGSLNTSDSSGEACDARVAVVSPKPPPVHGAAIAVGELIESSLVERFGIRHVDARFTGEVADLQRFRLDKVRRLFGVLRAIRRTLRGEGADVVVLTPTFLPKPFLKDAVLIWWTWFHRPREILAWLHMDFETMNYARRNAAFRWFARATLRRCTRMVCVAPRLQERLPEFLCERPVHSVMNGVADCFAGDALARRPGQGVRVVFLSHMGIAKGWELLFEQAERLCAQFTQVKFHFYGGPAADSSEERIRARFLGGRWPERVVWHGFVQGEAKTAALRDASLFCFPSFNEAFPLTVLEAMSAGLPIVASDAGAVRDALVEGEGAYLVPPRNGERLHDALAQLIGDPAARERMGAFNRKRYEELFTVERYLTRWSDLLSLLEAKRERAAA
ncbi:MAG TPA: glycosyltransferase family 4 protein [Verrucomicrobiales bacterium]|nr:glycosyltransferase family 4 protein [Verrucomicrobiales bacterium]